MSITIYPTRKVITMNPSNPKGTHVAVRNGMILGVGSLDELSGWGATYNVMLLQGAEA